MSTKRKKESERRIKKMLLLKEVKEEKPLQLKEKVLHQQREPQLLSKKKTKAPRLFIQKQRTMLTVKLRTSLTTLPALARSSLKLRNLERETRKRNKPFLMVSNLL